MNQIAGTRYYKWLAGFAAVALIAGLIVAPRLLPNNSGSRPRITFAQMQAQADGGLTAHWDEQTGVPDFLTGPIPYHLTSAERADPRSAAIGVLSRYRELFAMRDPARELVVTRVENDARGGQTLVRLRQVFEGLPVFGQTLLVHIDSQAIVGINGHYVPGIDVPTQAAVTAENATTAALKAAESEMPAATAPAELLVFVGDDGRANLAWKIPLKTLKPYDKLAYFIDAQNGTALHVMPLLDGDKYRKIYDAQLKENLPGRLLAQEGEVPRDQAGAAAYQFTGQTYDYYKNTFGRDSYDDHGGTIIAIVHFPELGNSHWDGDNQVLTLGDTDNYLTNRSDA
ncbi:MAG: hypothetical protein HY023_07175, partial [Chloroflexi bacterium]|nr:hypothetical protein [Chloroflexota bacterium]